MGYSITEEPNLECSWVLLYATALFGGGGPQDRKPHQKLVGYEKMSHDNLPGVIRKCMGDGCIEAPYRLPSSHILGGHKTFKPKQLDCSSSLYGYLQGCQAIIEEPFPYNSTFLLHTQLGILSINTGHRLWPLWRYTMGPIQNLVQMLRLMPLTHQEDIQRFTHITKLYGESRIGFQSWFKNSWESKKRKLAWIFIVVKGWG